MRRDQWSGATLAREAVKNLFTLRSRMFGLIAMAVLLGSSAVAYAAWESAGLRNQLTSEARQGRNIVTITAADQKRPAVIDRASCEHLTTDADVAAAGLVRPEGSADFLQLGPDVPVLGVSTTLLPALTRTGAIIGDQLRHPGPPFRLLLPDGLVTDAVTGADQPDVIGTNSAVVVGIPPSASTTNACTVILTPFTDTARVSTRITTELQSTGGPLAASTQFSEPQNPLQVYLQRPARYLPLLLALIGALSAGTLNRRRASEWAAYALSGTSPRSLLTIQVLEQIGLAGCFTLAATAATALLTAQLLSPTAVLARCIAAGALWIVAAIALSVDLPLRRPTDLAKDR